MLIDGMPKEAYLHWMHEILHYYDTISVDEELSDAVTTTDNEHKQLLTASIQKLGRQFIITTTDKATGCCALFSSAGI
jgi:sugar/nucleoside kinase (ribokinase family)